MPRGGGWDRQDGAGACQRDSHRHDLQTFPGVRCLCRAWEAHAADPGCMGAAPAEAMLAMMRPSDD